MVRLQRQALLRQTLGFLYVVAAFLEERQFIQGIRVAGLDGEDGFIFRPRLVVAACTTKSLAEFHVQLDVVRSSRDKRAELPLHGRVLLQT